MKRLLLVGCGAEIGSMIVGMLDPAKDGMEIAAILTHPAEGDPHHPETTGLDSLVARVVMAQPHLVDEVSADRAGERLVVRGQSIPVFWGDVADFDSASLPGPFDGAILATSKKHLGDLALMERLASVAGYVVGVAEGLKLPAVYPCLIGAPEAFLPVRPEPVNGAKAFALGSCQTNGWQAQLRALLDLAADNGFKSLDFKAMEVDIVHPDTPTGRLGTKSIAARDQDPRNNLRPSFSQVESSMNRLFPESANANTVSLRVLTSPPGYQISRFFFSYDPGDGARLDHAGIANGFAKTAARNPHILRVAERPLGSRGYEFSEAAAVVLTQSALMRFNDDPFRAGGANLPVSELIVQAYVHNTRGYCRSVIEALRYLLSDPAPKAFPAMAA